VAEDPAYSTTPTGSPHGALLIVTGASHTGKTSVIQALVPHLHPPVALLGVDNTLEHTLVIPEGDRWAEIPLAYRLIQGQLNPLLDEGWLVVVESTFTYVPEEGQPSFHSDVLKQMILAAEQRGAASLVCQLQASVEATEQRQRDTGRIDPEVVAATERLHRSVEMPRSTRKAGRCTVMKASWKPQVKKPSTRST